MTILEVERLKEKIRQMESAILEDYKASERLKAELKGSTEVALIANVKLRGVRAELSKAQEKIKELEEKLKQTKHWNEP